MEPLEIALSAAWLALAALLAWGLASPWRAVMREETPPLIFRMLERQGIAWQTLEASVSAEELGRAAQRCALCAEKTRCRHWLAGAASGDYRAFCPNAGFIEAARRR